MDMKGYVDEYPQPKVSIVVKGLRHTVRVKAVVDTAFNGDLCLPIALGIQIGLELRGNQEFELADGTIKRELTFIGHAVIENEERAVDISLTNSEEALMGCGLLKGQKSEIGFSSGTLTIAPEAEPGLV